MHCVAHAEEEVMSDICNLGLGQLAIDMHTVVAPSMLTKAMLQGVTVAA